MIKRPHIDPRKAAFVFVLAGTLFSAKAVSAASYHVNLATSALTGGIYSGPYTMDFQFIDGGGSSGEPNNLATLSGFTYGGGSGPASLINLSDGIVPGPGEATVSFTPGSTLGFDVSVTTNQDTGAGATPDSFSFALLDGNDDSIPTSDPGDAFFYITESGDPRSPAPVVSTFSASNGRGGTFSPTVTVQSASAPEPAGLPYGVIIAVCLALGQTQRQLPRKAARSQPAAAVMPVELLR